MCMVYLALRSAIRSCLALGGLKTQDQKMEDQMSWIENAGPKNQDRKIEDQQPEADYGM